MSYREYKKRRRQRRRIRRSFGSAFLTFLGISAGIIFIAAASIGVFSLGKKLLADRAQPEPIEITAEPLTEPADSLITLLRDAERLAAGYDYDAAIELLKSSTDHQDDPQIIEKIAEYESTISTLVPVNIDEVTHVFFHSLIVEPSKAFDGDSRENGYNQVMTTVDEFQKILQSMYEKGFVLVRLHDLAYESTDENGETVMKKGNILLPEGKKAFVMSQDDVCYYPYMDGDGFASRIVIGEDGKPTCEMIMDDGSISTGPYDLVPILENFIEEHPDFSYRGARAILAFTGYEGILGYRTTASYADSETYEKDRNDAQKVAQCLKDNGWELASHSWGHLNLGAVDMERFTNDTDKWEEEVDSLIGPTDIILFPFGSDIGDWHPYTTENERFNYLYNAGFRYFCNVDSSQYWAQLGQKHFRQGRRNLDGYRMWQDIIMEDQTKRRLDDLFRAEDVFDESRPTPVPDM
ncbi:MAG: polysaccharide deacetylase family protein [Brotaphodocola sp.]